MLDLDFFKRVTTRSATAPETGPQARGRLLKTALRAGDVAARVAGRNSPCGCRGRTWPWLEVAERLRALVEAKRSASPAQSIR